MKKVFTLICIIFIPFITIGQFVSNNEDLDTIEEINQEGITDVVDDETSTMENEIINNNIIDEYETNNENTDTDGNTNIDEDIDNNEDIISQINKKEKYGLGDIIFGFCNEGDDNLSQSLNYAVSQGKPLDICLFFYNTAPEDIKIQIRIVDQDVTAQGDPTCDYTSTKIQQFISKEDLTKLNEIILPAGEYVKKSFSVKFPIGIEGNIDSCLTYNVPKDNGDSEEGAGFSVIINDGFYMNFFVGDIASIKNDILFENLYPFKDDNGELNINFNLINTGNLEDKIVINGTITNILGFHKDFSIKGDLIQVKPGDIVPVTANLGSIPSYGGRFKINFVATATPFFSYDISNSSIDPALLEAKEFTVSTTFFQMPWLILIILVIFILLIITIFRKPKEKVVYIQAPQQPTPNNGYQQPQYQNSQQPQQPQVAQTQPQYQQPQVAQPQYQQPAQPTENQNNYGQQPTQPTPNQYTPST